MACVRWSLIVRYYQRLPRDGFRREKIMLLPAVGGTYTLFTMYTREISQLPGDTIAVGGDGGDDSATSARGRVHSNVVTILAVEVVVVISHWTDCRLRCRNYRPRMLIVCAHCAQSLRTYARWLSRKRFLRLKYFPRSHALTCARGVR